MRLCHLIAAFALALAAAPAAGQQLLPEDVPALFDPDFTDPQASEEAVSRGFSIAKGGATRGGVGMKCMACHGLEGQGSTDGTVPRLAGLPRDYLVEQLRAFREGTRVSPVMAPIAGGLTETELTSVASYYATREAMPLDTPREVPVEVIQQGGALAQSGLMSEGGEITACVMCHDAEADGRDGHIPSLAGQHAPYIAAQLRAWKNGERNTDPLGVMEEIARHLSEQDIEAVSAFYAEQPPNR